ncbi:tetratricopeptide (TPR) repeat protein [Catenulispora sp. EB89]|uniref:hypothetical protein n=1 Tax=Catenulispora sp. EB89 TaxID=3156257 RepID=UPI00351290D8
MAANAGGAGGGSDPELTDRQPSDPGLAEDELQRCRVAIAAADLPHAATHLGRALAYDPSQAAAYTCLDQIAEAAGSSAAARELFKGDGSPVGPGNAAAIVALLAGEGQSAKAVELLGAVAAAAPDLPWADAPWFSPQLALTLPEISIGRAVSAVWQAIGNPAPPRTAQAMEPWLAFTRTAAARPGVRADLLCEGSALARRVGAHDEAIAWCRLAAQRDTQTEGVPSQHTLIMLGYAYRDAGQPGPAIETWTKASARKPANADLMLDLADLTFDQGDFAASRRWAERSAAVNSTSPKIRAALLAATFRAETAAGTIGAEIAPLIELADLSAAHPTSDYIRARVTQACRGAAWLTIVPPPTEAVCSAYGHFAHIEDSGEGTVTRSFSTTLEAPTPTNLYRMRFPQAVIEDAPVIEPDPRIPVTTQYGPPLWTYDGTVATATVPPPSARAVELLHDLAAGIWADPLVAYDHAAGFAALEVADLLALLAHLPPPRETGWIAMSGEHPLYWERLAQVWVCIGILHQRSQEPWATSTRRTQLLRLLFGPEDWTVDAAAFALCVSAWRFPAQRTEIAEAIGQRYLAAAKALGKRPTQLHAPLAQVLLICPGVDAGLAARARKALAAQQQAMRATDVEGMKDSLLRRFTRRKER